ncbi:hypothetical protein [Spiroplasma clarkii]|uniref:Uncharacterized protein n=1 Tax=Spiroplasma clarkii TaxID=2139 RepID=A0A2K8KHJ5_9MOLU|nr:hypothetical protein [Spiroplasma clarkii]ATX71150.1 hypothetical protein SCLAR_v1c08420 [Spiroplasma clarkii]
MQKNEFNKDKGKFLLIYRILVLIFLGIITSVLIYYVSQNDFDLKLIVILSLFVICLFYCFINYFMIPILRFKNFKQSLLCSLISQKFIVKKFRWKKEIVALKGDTIILITRNEDIDQKYQLFAQNNCLKIVKSNNFKTVGLLCCKKENGSDNEVIIKFLEL